ncbi:MAG: hypothetical protein F6J93_13340 [Oscillatoria sp. SIO1A7]|nr:hypothetical protein [Oscillatoria sp. SIO1A7]
MGCSCVGKLHIPDRFRELESPTVTLDSGFNWERSRLSKKTVTTPHHQHPTPHLTPPTPYTLPPHPTATPYIPNLV